MEKITDNKNWNVYWEHCGMTSKQYFVSQFEGDDRMRFVNDKRMAISVCEALNNAKVK